MDMGGAELIATGFDDDLGLQPTEEATPEFGGELLAGIEEPLATAEEEPLLGDDADLDDMALDLVETETAEERPSGGESVTELQDAILDNPDDPALTAAAPKPWRPAEKTSARWRSWTWRSTRTSAAGTTPPPPSWRIGWSRSRPT